jgi:hypothetical protein
MCFLPFLSLKKFFSSKKGWMQFTTQKISRNSRKKSKSPKTRRKKKSLKGLNKRLFSCGIQLACTNVLWFIPRARLKGGRRWRDFCQWFAVSCFAIAIIQMIFYRFLCKLGKGRQVDCCWEHYLHILWTVIDLKFAWNCREVLMSFNGLFSRFDKFFLIIHVPFSIKIFVLGKNTLLSEEGS